MFNDNEYRFGAFAGLVALILVFALTIMAFKALEPPREGSSPAQWTVATPEPNATVVPTFGS
ncbi:MAG: hypothetical protein KDA35_00755 [Hyphomonadaceae bacterium]|nr:hypothetical protein [Hyphomonadaceae bacterium]